MREPERKGEGGRKGNGVKNPASFQLAASGTVARGEWDWAGSPSHRGTSAFSADSRLDLFSRSRVCPPHSAFAPAGGEYLYRRISHGVLALVFFTEHLKV